MATAVQFASPHCQELFSFSAHFLHFLGRQFGQAAREFLALFSVKQGERHFTCAVHPPVHRLVHPIGLITSLCIKHLAMPQCVFWTWRGRGVGWNDPAFCRTVRPKGFSGVVPAHSRGRKVSTMQMSAISIP